MPTLSRLCLVLALAAAASALAGCDDGKGARTTPALKHITLWHIQTPASVTNKVIEDAIGRFEDAHEGLAVMPSPCKNDVYKEKLSRAMAAGSMPDVFHTWGGGVLKSFVLQKQVADLTAMAEADNLTKRVLPAALKFGTIDGKIYAVPMDVSAVVMWYNRAIFEKNGVEPPTTFEELKAACAKLRAAGVIPIALGNKDKWPGSHYFIYLATRIGGTKPFADAEGRAPGGTFEAPAFLEAGRRMQELVKAGAFNAGIDALDYDGARGLFVREQAAMILMGTWFLADLKSDLKDGPQALLDKVDCFAFPSVEGGRGDPKIIVGGINSAYAVSAKCAYPREAFQLIKEFTSDATAMKWAETGRIPALKPELLLGLLDKNTEKAASLLFDAPEIQLYYDQALRPDLGELFKSTTQSLIAGTITPEEAARRMETLAAEPAAAAKTKPTP